jgi:hypothetical protein
MASVLRNLCAEFVHAFGLAEVTRNRGDFGAAELGEFFGDGGQFTGTAGNEGQGLLLLGEAFGDIEGDAFGAAKEVGGVGVSHSPSLLSQGFLQQDSKPLNE